MNATAKVSSSLITGGRSAAHLRRRPATVGVTIDRGNGVVDPKGDLGKRPMGAALAAADRRTHVFDSSIAVEQVETFGSLICTYSNPTATAESGAGCQSGAGKPGGNFASPLSACSTDAAGGDYDLPASSPARDAGRARV